MKSLRGAICRVVEGEQEVFVESTAEREAIAAAIEAGKPKPFDDEVGANCKLLPVGARVLGQTIAFRLPKDAPQTRCRLRS